MPPRKLTVTQQTLGPDDIQESFLGDPQDPRLYSAAEKAALKGRVDSITAEVEDLKRQIDLKKEVLSDAVFELKSALGGRPFKDVHGNVWMFSSRGKENPTHFLRRQGAQDIEEL
jgi:hypothetical protein